MHGFLSVVSMSALKQALKQLVIIYMYSYKCTVAVVSYIAVIGPGTPRNIKTREGV